MKALPIVAILILISLGVIFFTKQTPDKNLPTVSSPTPVVVENTEGGVELTERVVYTESGYAPSEITVKPGTKVVFVNESDSPMWTASDPHPIHSDYSTFDSRMGVVTGGVYEFTFTEAGSYSYHDHLSPRNTGTITVEN